jgi:hypothetical protein
MEKGIRCYPLPFHNVEVKEMKKYIFVILIVLLTGCSLQNLSKVDTLPGVSIPINEMNKKILLHEAVGMMDAYKVSGLLFLDLENLSNNPISLPPDYGSKIFIKTEKGWQLLNNNFSYSNMPIVLPTKEQYPPGLSVVVWPVLPETDDPTVLRIVVIGEIADSNEIVGAYLDIVLK